MRRRFVAAAAALTSLALSQQAWASHGPQHGGHMHDAAADQGAAGRHDVYPAASHWSAPADARAAKNPVHASVASRQRGEALYQHNCAVCHGLAGRGDGPGAQGLPVAPANLFEMAPRHPDGDIAWKIANGRGSMPAWEGVLATAQIWDLVNYLRDLPRAAAGSLDQPSDGHTPD